MASTDKCAKSTSRAQTSCWELPTCLVLVGLMVLLCAPDSAAQQGSSDHLSRLETAITFYSKEQYSEAISLLELLAQSEPDRKDTYWWLGKAYSRVDRWDDAIGAYKNCYNLDSEDSEGPVEIARIYKMLGNTNLALMWYKTAADLKPDDKNLADEIDQIESRQSNAVAAPGEDFTPEGNDEVSDLANLWHRVLREGIAGLLGARGKWWGRLIASVLLVSSLFHGAYMLARFRQRRFPLMPVGVVVVQMLIGSSITYILYWGIPNSALSWGLFAGCLVLSAITVVGVNQSDDI